MKKNWSIIVTLFVLAVILPTHANAATEVTTLPQLEAALGRDETEIIIKNDIQLSTALTIHTDVTMHSDENGPYRISIDADERHFYVTGNLTLENIVLNGKIEDQTQAATARGGIVVDKGTLTLGRSAVIQNCSGGIDNVNSSGGGVYVSKNGTLYLNDNAKVDACYAYTGAGVSVQGGIFYMNGSTVSNCYALDNGGGILLGDGGILEISNGTISTNTINNGMGAGVCAYAKSAVIMTGGSIAGNNGGGLAVIDNSRFTMQDGRIENNVADSSAGGGVVVYNQSACEMSGGSISGNQAFTGGGVYLSGYDSTSPSTFQMSGGSIRDNEAILIGNGGGVHMQYNSVFEMSGGSIEGNHAINGAGVYMGNFDDDASNTFQMSGGSINGNEASEHGGGIFLSHTNSTFTSTAGSIINNTAAEEGGAIYTVQYYINWIQPMVYASAMDASADYVNISTSKDTAFSGNTASGLYNPPTNAADFTNIAFANVSGSPLSTHPINNFDINYVYGNPLEYVTVTYHANDEATEPKAVTLFLEPNATHIVLANTDVNIGMIREGYAFINWNTASDGSGTAYRANEELSITANMDLYAVWKKNPSGGGGGGSTTYTVTYNANGGTGSHSDSGLSSGATYTVKSQSATGIAYTGYTFDGWNTTADGKGTAYAAADTLSISGNVTLYAQWKSATGNSDSGKPELNTADHMAYVIGYTDGTVKPTANISRAETATIFFRLLTDSSRASYWTTTNDYNDMNAENWFHNAVSTMSNAGIITGYTDGTFGGNRNITRAEFAAIAARFDSGAYTGSDKFSDISGHWAAEYINRAAEKGWITGYEDGTFKPDQNITRAEAMTLINRVLGRDNIASMHADMKIWPDNPSTAWYYEAVQEATNSHDYTRNSSTSAESWTAFTAAPNWAALEKSWSTANDL